MELRKRDVEDVQEGWTDVETYHLMRMNSKLVGDLTTTFGVSEEGDPYMTVQCPTGDVLVSVAKEEDYYVLQSILIDGYLVSKRLDTLIRNFLNC